MLRIQLLGSVRAVGEAGSVPLRGVGQRALLARLALSAGRVVSHEDLTGGQPGAGGAAAKRTLQSHVSRLRAALAEGAPGACLARQEPGYVLLIPPEAVDALSFEDRVGKGIRALEDGVPDAASRLLASTLGSWRGAALADARATEWLDREALRLEGLRVRGTVRWLEAEVAVGRHLSAIEPLQRLARENPLHEQVWELVMLALYRSGRQADALAAFRRTRRLLRQELGAEPGPGLEALEHRILNQDPALALPVSGPPGGQAHLGGLQIQKLEYVFRAMDTDGDGFLVADDFARHADRLQELTGAAAEEGEAFRQNLMGWWEGALSFSQAEGPDRVGRDDWLAFWSWWLGRVSADAAVGGGEFLAQIKTAIELAFDMVDSDHDGRYSYGDYDVWVRAWGFAFDTLTVFKELDVDGDGFLTRKEVVQLTKDFYLTNDPEAPGNFVYGPPF